MKKLTVNDFSLKNKPIVIDSGSTLTKSGFAGENRPRSIIPTVIGYPKSELNISEMEEYYIGEDALQLREVLKLIHPIERGEIKDWDAMEKIWNYIFYTDLKVDPMLHPIMLTEPPFNSKSNREKSAEIMFEIFNVPALYIAMEAELSLFASGRTTGCVIDIGHEISHIVPIDRKCTLTHSISRANYGGNHITSYLESLLRQKGISFTRTAEKQIVRDIKEKLCYVAMDPEREMMLSKMGRGIRKSYTLPDGETIYLSEERFLTPESLFIPGIVLGLDEYPLDDIIVASIKSCDHDIQHELYTNLVLSGGSSLFPGLRERLIKEIKEQIPDPVGVTIIAPQERMYSAWIGGSILGSIKSFNRWVTKKEYREEGPQKE